jgi:acyl-CoA synthetase (AMP-forming)/AMP-acid ligase II
MARTETSPAAVRTLDDLGAIVENNALRSPDRVAVREPAGSARTYANLDSRTTRLANALRALGLAPGDRIAGWMDDVVEYVELYVAAAKAELVMVPLNNRLTPSEADFQLDRTGARALVYTPELEPSVEALAHHDELLLIVARYVEGCRGRDFEEIIGAGSATRLGPRDPDAAWMICFTSGTTGQPKGAVLTHRSVMTVAMTQLIGLRIPMYGIDIHAVSMSFPATVASHIVPHLLAGGTVVLAAAKWDSERLLDLISRERGTHIYVPGPALEEFATVAAADRSSWKTLVSVLHAGSRADPKALADLAAVIGGAYIEGWGMTEISGGLVTATSPGDVIEPDEAFFATVGRPVPGTVVMAVDENRTPVGPGEHGELAVRSASLFRGYWDDEEATSRAIEDGWYYSGDMGSVDGTGRVSISDRRNNLIVSGGMNIYPAEVELVLARHPGVRECAVVGLPHPRWGQTPVAVVVADPAANLTEEALIGFARERLASYKKPTGVIFTDELPRTTGGKLARGKLRERFATAPGGN